MTRGSDTTGEQAAARSAHGIAVEDAAEPSGAPAPRARAILVLGTPRSGTSALIRLFNVLGADIPEVPTVGGSRADFRAWDDLRTLNDELLRSAGSSWQDWRAFDRDWYASSFAASFKQRLLDLLHANFSGSSLFVLSDPRICRIAPLWLEALSDFDVQPSAVIAVRDPVEVAESLQQRDGISPPNSYLLWLRNILDAERATRDVPRAVTIHRELLDDWSCLVETLAARLDLAWPRSVESVRDAAERLVTRRVRHHEAKQEKAAEQVVLIDWVKSTYAAMTRLAHVGTDEHSLKRLDRISGEFDVACLAFGPVTGPIDIADPAGNPQRNEVEQDPTHSAPVMPQADRIGHGEYVEQLTRELAKLREDLERKNSELEMSSTELGVLRALSAIREPSTASEHRPNRLKAGVQFLLWRGLGVLGRMGYRIERSAQAEAIRSSGLFDDSWYLERYPDVAGAGLDPLFHYLEFGAWEGRDPHPLFDQVWYRATYPEVQTQKQTPLGHFVTVGAASGHNPNPLFHTAWYAASHTDIGAANPLRHYIEHAAEEGRNPNPLFDSAWYLKENPDVAATGVNPLAHYIHHGIAEARDPHPAFDTDWYVKQHEHVAVSGMDALEHYLSFGVVRGYRTRPSNRGGDGRRRAETRRQRDALRLPNEAVIERATVARQIEGEFSGASIDIYRTRMVLRTTSPVAAPFTGHIGVFVHLFYDDLASEIAASLLNIPFDTKVYISTNSKEKKETIHAAFRQFGFTPVIKVLPNRGWDIAPFLLGFADEIGNHEICLKLHGKRSRHGYENSERGNAWRKHLLSRLLAHPRNVGFIVDSFSAHPDLGVVMPRHWRGIARQARVIGPNYLHMRRLLTQISVSIAPDQPIEFPSGSMFWFRKAALQPLLDLGLSWSDFARCRPRDRDATIAHGIERCILMFAAHAGFRWAFMPRGWVRRSLPSQGRSGGLQRRSDRMADFG